MMQHKGYCGIVEVDEEAGILVGRVLGLRDVITFQGETVAAARRAFRGSVDDYLEFCRQRGEAPEKPYSGKFLVRIPSSLHSRLAMFATAQGVSLNEAVTEAIKALVQRQHSERAEVARPAEDLEDIARGGSPEPARPVSRKGRNRSPAGRPTTKPAGSGKSK